MPTIKFTRNNKMSLTISGRNGITKWISNENTNYLWSGWSCCPWIALNPLDSLDTLDTLGTSGTSIAQRTGGTRGAINTGSSTNTLRASGTPRPGGTNPTYLTLNALGASGTLRAGRSCIAGGTNRTSKALWSLRTLNITDITPCRTIPNP